MPGDLTTFAAEQQRIFDSLTSADERKRRGHFGTPSAIAEFMADMFTEIPQGTISILDPGAGVGILAAALCQRVLREQNVRILSLTLWENDRDLEPYLRATMEHCRQALRDAGHEMTFNVRQDDFVMAHRGKTLFDKAAAPTFQLAIINPPYFKLRKDSAQARAMRHIVHGQPNIYALFLAAASDLLIAGGEMVAITPRSYFSGPYFKRFRKWFFNRMAARHLHLFESRTEAFHEDAVLQETVILKAVKHGRPDNVILTTSQGRDLSHREQRIVPERLVIDRSNGGHIVRVVTNSLDEEIIQSLDSLPGRFRNSGFEVSTGPVVTFRSTGFLRHEESADTAPLLWMHNVRPFETRFPRSNGKPNHIAISESSKRLLLPATRYILLKRFTSKEEKRRLVAGIMDAKDSYSDWVGLENHLNYLYRRDAELTSVEAFGLAAFLNSALVDRYFRAISGNTQVNAAEIREMPIPNGQTLASIGEQVEYARDRGRDTVEHIVASALRLPRQLVGRLCEIA